MTDKIKRGDLLPKWAATLTDNDVPVDLTSASSIRVIFQRPDGTTRVVTGVTGTDQGKIEVAWEAADTATVGDLLAEIEVTWPGSRPQSFPVDDYLRTRIFQDMG